MFKIPFVFITISVFVLLIAILILRVLLLRQKDIPSRLFYAALKNENNGLYEEALTKYEAALIEVEKTKYNKALKIKILEKIKLLHTLIEYQNGVFHSNKNNF